METKCVVLNDSPKSELTVQNLDAVILTGCYWHIILTTKVVNIYKE